jgi:hypothetical protein
VRAEYQKPCEPYENNVPDGVGFFSGFQSVDEHSEGVSVIVLYTDCTHRPSLTSSVGDMETES